MPRVYIVNAQPEERSAFCLLLLDINMEIVGEASDWQTTLEQAPHTRFNVLLVDTGLLPAGSAKPIEELRRRCTNRFVAIAISDQDARQHSALIVGADDFISKSEPPKRLMERIQTAAKSLRREQGT